MSWTYRTTNGIYINVGDVIKCTRGTTTLVGKVGKVSSTRSGLVVRHEVLGDIGINERGNGWSIEFVKSSPPQWANEPGCIFRDKHGFVFKTLSHNVWKMAGDTKAYRWEEIVELAPLTRLVDSNDVWSPNG